jgi:hypothetical protein
MPGYYRLTGVAEPDAEVVARNRRTELLAGQLADKNARYDFVVQGLSGDQMELWYIIGNDQSPRTSFLLPSDESPGAAGAGGAP